MSAALAPVAPAATEPAAPAVLHIDLADVAAAAATAPAPSAPRPLDALELALLEEARRCVAAAPGTLPPRRELVAVALREAERHQWWRDQAEARAQELAHALSVEVAQAEEVRRQRHETLQVFFEVVAYVAPQLGCDANPRDVLARIRARGSGLLAHAPVPPHLPMDQGDGEGGGCLSD